MTFTPIGDAAMRVFAKLDSTALKSCDYDPDTRSLTVAFRNGRQYTHENVPDHVFQELRDAMSAGSYYSQYIKGQY